MQHMQLFSHAWTYPHPKDNLNVSYSIFRLNTLAMSSTMRQMTLTTTYHSMTSPYLLHAEGVDKKEQPISKNATSSFIKDCLASPVWRSVWGRGWPVDSKQVNWSFQVNINSLLVTQVLARPGNSLTHWQVKMSSHNFYLSFGSSHP